MARPPVITPQAQDFPRWYQDILAKAELADNGLRLPPVVAPIQVVVIAVTDEPATLDAVAAAERSFRDAGLRVRADDRTSIGLGRRLTEWELKGVPVRVEIGPRDLAERSATITRRDSGERSSVALTGLADAITPLLDDLQASLAREAAERMERGTRDVQGIDEALEAARTGFARLAWSEVGEAGERRLNEEALSVRCLQRSDGDVPGGPDEDGLIAIVGRSY
jgi:prolyl-tRNA synthetase